MPAAASYIFVGLELGVVFALIAEVVMEFISGRPGLGSLIQEAAATLDSANAFGALILLALLGISVSALVKLARNYGQTAALAAGFQGWALKRATPFERVMFLAAGFALVYPTVTADLIGIGLVVVALALQYFRDRPVLA